MRVLVTGATGNVGRPTVEALRARGHGVVAAVRAEDATPFGDQVDRAVLDFRDPSTWDRALDGVDGLFLLRPPAIADVGATLNPLVDRAVARGVSHVVFLSVVGAGQVKFIPHRTVEDHLRGKPTRWTFLRAGFFMQNLSTAYRDDVRRDDRLYVPAGTGAVAWVDTVDIAAAAAVAFDRGDTAAGQAWVLTGAEALTFAEVAVALSEVLGRPIRYEPATLLGYARHLQLRGLPLGQVLVQAVLHTAIRFGREGVVDPTLAEVLGRAPMAMRGFLERERAAWA